MKQLFLFLTLTIALFAHIIEFNKEEESLKIIKSDFTGEVLFAEDRMRIRL